MSNSLRFFRQRGMVALVALWVAATVVLLCADRASALVGIGICAFVGIVVLLGYWLLPRGTDDPIDVFRQAGSGGNVAIRGVVIAAAYAAACLLPQEPVGLRRIFVFGSSFARILRCSSVTKLRLRSLIAPRLRTKPGAEYKNGHSPTGS